MFIDRYLIFITPAFFLLTAIGVNYLERKTKIPFTILVLALMGITMQLNVDNKRDVRQLVSKVKEIKSYSTIVYLCPDYFDKNLAYYYNRDLFKDIDEDNINGKLMKNLQSENIFPINFYTSIDTSMFNLSDKVIYIDAAADFCYPQNGILPFLIDQFEEYKLYEIPEIFKVYEFQISKRKIKPEQYEIEP